ncbi:LacI family transcriptional regulator [bacterium]|nr:MAG: LacI family transcriptional regulator [bacterium]
MKTAKSRPNARIATLSQVAKKAGVHPVTASRALQNDERVALATREEIQRIAREMNYTPSSAARALVMGRTETIAVATGSISEHYYANILHLMEAELTASNYKMLMLRSRDIESDLLSIVSTNAVDGVIAIDAFPSISDLVRSNNHRMLPCVYVGYANPDWEELSSIVDTVKVDLAPAVRQAVQIMLDEGCKRIAYVAGDGNMASEAEVRSGVYQKMMGASGHCSEVLNLEINTYTSNHHVVRDRFKAYVRRHGHPDGILCQNDEVAISVYRALLDLGLRIPQDVRLVGCDGLDYMDYFDPPLSTIVQPAQEMCALAWRFLRRRIENPSLPHQLATLRAALKIRPSLAAAAPIE